MSKPTQNERVLQYMIDFGSITQLEALQNFGCMRLASRISDLRKKGYHIESKMVHDKNRYDENISYARYNLKGDQPWQTLTLTK